MRLIVVLGARPGTVPWGCAPILDPLHRLANLVCSPNVINSRVAAWNHNCQLGAGRVRLRKRLGVRGAPSNSPCASAPICHVSAHVLVTGASFAATGLLTHPHVARHRRRHACSRPSRCGSRSRLQVCAVLLVLGCELHFSTLSSFIGCHLGLNSGCSFGNFDGAFGKQVCQCTRLHTGCVCSAPLDRRCVSVPHESRAYDAFTRSCCLGLLRRSAPWEEG